MEKHLRSNPSRRRFLRIAAAGAIAGLTAQVELAGPPAALAQSSLSPDRAIEELMAGNRRFTSGALTAHQHDLAILKQKTIEKQEPFAGVLSCADSRVPIECSSIRVSATSSSPASPVTL